MRRITLLPASIGGDRQIDLVPMWDVIEIASRSLTAVVTVLSNADAMALRPKFSREPEGLSLISPIQRHMPSDARRRSRGKGSIDGGLDDVWSEEGEPSPMRADRSLTPSRAAIASKTEILPATISSSPPPSLGDGG